MLKYGERSGRMTWQNFIDIVSNIFSNSLVASLLGVTIGGFITYNVQKHSIERQQQFEREKIKDEENKRNQDIKIKAYSKILQLSSTHIISELEPHTGQTELYGEKYYEHIQPILYEIYHLLDDEIAKEFDYIETTFEKIYIIGPDDDDNEKWWLGESYSRILTSIRKEFENIRNNRSSS